MTTPNLPTMRQQNNDRTDFTRRTHGGSPPEDPSSPSVADRQSVEDPIDTARQPGVTKTLKDGRQIATRHDRNLGSDRKMKDELDRYAADNARLRRELDEERQERQRRDAQVESMRQYAMANDISQGSEAVELIEEINNTVSSFATGLSLNWKLPEQKGSFKGSGNKLEGLLPALVKCHLPSPQAGTLLKNAIQSHILEHVSYIMNRECHGMDHVVSGIICKLERSIQNSESQATFSRWRVLTYNALYSEQPCDRQELTSQTCQQVTNSLRYFIMLLTGTDMDQIEYKNLWNAVQEIMPEIISKSVQFSRMVHTKILSANYRHFSPFGGSFNGMSMEMPHSDTVPEEGDRIVAITRLGLLRQEKMGREGFGETTDVESVALKAEVLTQKEVQERAKEPTQGVLQSIASIPQTLIQPFNRLRG